MCVLISVLDYLLFFNIMVLTSSCIGECPKKPFYRVYVQLSIIFISVYVYKYIYFSYICVNQLISKNLININACVCHCLLDVSASKLLADIVTLSTHVKRFWSQAIIQALTSKCPIDVSSCPKYSTIQETILMMLVFADVVGRGFPLDFSHKRKVAGHAPDLPRPRKTLVWRKKCLQCKHAEVSP